MPSPSTGVSGGPLVGTGKQKKQMMKELEAKCVFQHDFKLFFREITFVSFFSGDRLPRLPRLLLRLLRRRRRENKRRVYSRTCSSLINVENAVSTF